MNQTATIAVIFICILIGALAFYFVLSIACKNLVRQTWEVTQKAKKADVELAPPSGT